MDALTDADYISSFVGQRLATRGLAHAPVSLRRYSQGPGVADSKLVFLSEGRHAFVVTISPALFPNIVAEEWLKAEQMRSHLGDLGTPILEPLDSGRIQTSSYVVVPYRKPLSTRLGLRWLDRIVVRRPLLLWLLQVAQRLSAACETSRYEASLQALRAIVCGDSATATLLREAGAYLESGRFEPRSSPMHGDIWKGNVLHGAKTTPFTLVDWRGSETDGFPIFDLVHGASSFGLSPKALYRELQLHRAALGCQPEDLPLYLLGALGHYAARLSEMPLALFRKMSDDCVRLLSSGLGSSP